MIIDTELYLKIKEATKKEYDIEFMNNERDEVMIKNENEVIEDLLEVIENENK